MSAEGVEEERVSRVAASASTSAVAGGGGGGGGSPAADENVLLLPLPAHDDCVVVLGAEGRLKKKPRLDRWKLA